MPLLNAACLLSFGVATSSALAHDPTATTCYTLPPGDMNEGRAGAIIYSGAVEHVYRICNGSNLPRKEPSMQIKVDGQIVVTLEFNQGKTEYGRCIDVGGKRIEIAKVGSAEMMTYCYRSVF